MVCNPLISFGWETWIRTKIHGVRVRCPTIERSPSRMVITTVCLVQGVVLTINVGHYQ
jgi:hypothetical protein